MYMFYIHVNRRTVIEWWVDTTSDERTVGRTDKHTQKGDKMKLKMIRAKVEDK